MNGVDDRQKNAGPQNGLAAMKEGVFLQLLVTGGVFAVAFGGINYAAAGDTLRFVRKAEYPAKADDCCDDDYASQYAHRSIS